MIRKPFDVITSFIPQLQPLLDDAEVSEIIVTADGNVAVERDGVLHRDTGVFLAEADRLASISMIATRLGDSISEEQPMLDATLPDGSRVSAVMPPVSPGGTHINIRKFRMQYFDGPALVESGMLTDGMLDLLIEAIKCRRSILISGPPGAGKTTLLNALAGYFPASEHIVVVEDTAELKLNMPISARLVARRSQMQGDKVLTPEISLRRCMRQVLRMRPDRLIVGEVRGAEAFDLLVAGNAGTTGLLASIHANSAESSLGRLRTLAAMSGDEVPDRAIARMIAEVFSVLVHVDRIGGRRKISEVLIVKRFDAATDEYEVLKGAEKKAA